MPKSTTEVTLTDFEGVATGFSARFKDTEFTDLDDWWVTPNKTLRVRNGINTHGTQDYDNGKILGKFSTGNDYLIISHDGGLDPVFISNGNTLGTGFIDTDPADLMLVANLVAYFFDNGSGANRNVRTWAGAGTADTGLTEKANLGTVHKSRFFVCNNETIGLAKSQLRYTDIFDLNSPDTAAGWTNGGTISVNPGDGDFITAVCVMNDTLFIFKRYSTWVLYTDGLDTSWTLRNIHPSIGCVGRDTPTVIGGLMYFISSQGLYRTDGTTFERLSDKVSDWFDSLPVTDLDCNERSAVWYENLYILNLDNFTVLYVYHIDNNCWTRWNTNSTPVGRLISMPEFAPWAFMTWFTGASGRLGMYHSDTEYGDLLPGGTPHYYKPLLATKTYDFDKPIDIKQILEVDIDMSSSGYDITTSFDVVSYFDQSNINTTVVVSDVATTIFLVRIGVNARTRKYALFLELQTPFGVEINSITFVMNLRGRAS